MAGVACMSAGAHDSTEYEVPGAGVTGVSELPDMCQGTTQS